MNSFYLIGCLLVSSCASSPMIQPQINSLVVAEQFPYALKILENNEKNYGPQNRLLYLLDYGLVLHQAGRYEDSIKIFEEAKKFYDRLFTVSLTRQAGTWLMNDNAAPYRAEDFERVIINIIQAVNFAVLGNIEEALVEARDVDIQLSLFNRQYPEGKKNVYKEDAFARFFMGILYETSGRNSDLNDAFISYAKAVEIYENDYSTDYKTMAPQILKENLLSLAQSLDRQRFDLYRHKYPDVDFLNFNEKKNKAEVYLIHYQGLSPVKHAFAIPIPLPDGFVTKLAFPKYDERICDHNPGILKAEDADQRIYQQDSELGEDISQIAFLNLNNRKARVIAKAALRSAGKYIFEEMEEKAIRKKVGENAGRWFKYLADLYNLASEQPDLRSWQTLPAEIRLARLILNPGHYKIFFNGRLLQEAELKAGEKKFFVARNNYYTQ